MSHGLCRVRHTKHGTPLKYFMVDHAPRLVPTSLQRASLRRSRHPLPAPSETSLGLAFTLASARTDPHQWYNPIPPLPHRLTVHDPSKLSASPF